MIHKLKNTSVRELIRALEKDGFQYKDEKAVREFTDTQMVVVS
jgi:predicted RNA binding protein YcfA (HicA-like mRNA interferase family)